MNDFSDFKRENRFHETDKEPTCFACTHLRIIMLHEFSCALAGIGENYMPVKITTVCKKFSPA